MNWNWILFGNQTIAGLKLVRLFLVLVPLSILPIGLSPIVVFFGLFELADWGGLGLLVGFYIWVIWMLVIECILYTIYLILKKIYRNTITVEDGNQKEDSIIFNILILYVMTVAIIGYLTFAIFSSEINILLTLTTVIVIELILIILYFTKFNYPNETVVSSIVDQPSHSIVSKTKSFLKLLLLFFLSVPILFAVMYFVSKLTS